MTGAGGVNLSAAHVAVAIVAAARLKGFDPAAAFQPSKKARGVRILAAAARAARTGASKVAIARLFRLHGAELAPSMTAKAGVTTDDLLEVAEALGAAGLAAAASAPPPEEKPKPPEGRRTQAPAATAKPSRKPGQKRPPPSRSASDQAAPPAPSMPAARRQTPPPLKRQASGRAGASARARARPSSEDPRAIPDLKPVSDDIARWGGYFLEAGWRLATVADLFEVCPVALLDTLDPQGVRV